MVRSDEIDDRPGEFPAGGESDICSPLFCLECGGGEESETETLCGVETAVDSESIGVCCLFWGSIFLSPESLINVCVLHTRSFPFISTSWLGKGKNIWNQKLRMEGYEFHLFDS